MPSKKGFYDGCVFLSHTSDALEISGWLNRKPVVDITAGTTSFRINSSSIVKAGDQLMKTLTNEYIGKVKSVDGTTITFEKGINISLTTSDYISIYPRFEIVKIETFGQNTYISELVPIMSTSIGSTLPDNGTWSSRTSTDFGGEGGASFVLGELVNGTVLEGRWSRVVIDSTALSPSTSEGAMCYLKASPTIM